MPRVDDPTAPINGRFWLATRPDAVFTGRLTLDGFPQVELDGELTPALTEVPSDSNRVRTFDPAPMGEEQLTLQGVLINPTTKVTLVDAVTISRESVGSALATERLQGEYALLGGHVDGKEATFHSADLRLRHLDHFARLPGLKMTISADRGSYQLVWAEPEPIVVDSECGPITFRQIARFPTPSLTGGAIETRAVINWKPTKPVRYYVVVRDLVDPLSTLLSLLFDEECPAVELVLDEAAGRRLTLYGPLVADEGKRAPKAPLFNAVDLGAECIRKWLATYPRLRPLPNIIAASHNGRTVESQLLQLTTAAEGLHRRLYPDSRQLTQTQVDTGLALLAEHVHDPAVSVAADALAKYLAEVSYPKRLQRLMDDTADAVPGLLGRANRWKKRVVDARVGFTHSMPGSSANSRHRYSVLSARRDPPVYAHHEASSGNGPAFGRARAPLFT